MIPAARLPLVAAGVLAWLSLAAPALAQDRPVDVFVGWAPVFFDSLEYQVLPAWAVGVNNSKPDAVNLALEASGRYFVPGGSSIHTVMGGPRWVFDRRGPARPFAQVLAGPSFFVANRSALGFAVVPGGGVDVPTGDGPIAIRVQGDFFTEFAPADYGRHQWTHLWRFSTGVVVRQAKK